MPKRPPALRLPLAPPSPPVPSVLVVEAENSPNSANARCHGCTGDARARPAGTPPRIGPEPIGPVPEDATARRRSLQDPVTLLAELHAKGVDLYLHQQELDTSTPAGKTMFQMMGVFAEFERAMIVERVKSGIARARSQGKHLGRPRLSAGQQRRIRDLLAAGTGIIKTAHIVGSGVSAVQRIKAEIALTD